MRKYSLLILVIIMTIVLAGIVFVQVNWIQGTLRTKEEIFKHDVTNAMKNVSRQLESKELHKLYMRFIDFTKSRNMAVESSISDFIFEQIDTTTNEKFTYKRKVLKQKYKVPKEVLKNDTLNELSREYAQKDVMISTQIINEKQRSIQYKTVEHESGFKELTDVERDNLKDLFIEKLKHGKITSYVGADELKFKIMNELQNQGIFIDFEFGIYKDKDTTSVHSDHFDPHFKEAYSTPLFKDKKGEPIYNLSIYFPKKKSFLLTNIKKNLILSLIFILFITGVFGMSLYQLNKQKKIDSIKSDFINNMTHEFKTPIATINLALDAILNPKVLSEPDRVKNYVEMIRQENARMNHQVENVLRVAKLDKKEKLEMECINMHEIIEDAISHVLLKIEQHNGKIEKSLLAREIFIKGNAFHTTNLIVNLLDNAIKYSKENPHIIISTYNNSKFLFIHVKDNGIGISKKAQKHIFDKFYREQSGDIHDTKGHGLGLAYVKRIVSLQQGDIHVVSEKNKGSTFIITFPTSKCRENKI